MIGFLRGQVVALKTDYCLLDVNGVGYRVFVSGSTRNKLRLKDEASLYTYMNVYQDGIKATIQWYLDNRQWWENIISGEYKDYYDRMYTKKSALEYATT